MLFDYVNVLVFASVGFAFVIVNTIVGSLIRPKRATDQGLEVYECGEETIGDTWVQFDIRYYTVALIYVIFAVEITFLFPWAMVLTEAYAIEAIGYWALAKGLLFITILLFGLAAVWIKGDLEWILTYSGPEYVPTQARLRPPVPTVDALTEEPDDAGEGESEDTDEAA
ncbi:MAG: NADH-quinone oxidoreductase subunit A [bacterium]|nr:NADH-quinone oxidoreductase subunit A [bacterium]